MKKLFAMLVAVTIVVSVCLVPVSAAEVDFVLPDRTNPSAVETASVSPRIIHTYQKTLTRTYANFEDIPTLIYYEEYNMGAWFRGNLSLKSVELQANGFWIATFSGQLQGMI